jgi:hypothetical protein
MVQFRKRTGSARGIPVRIVKIIDPAPARKAGWMVSDLTSLLRQLGHVVDERRLEEALGKRALGGADGLKQAALALAEVIKSLSIEEADAVMAMVAAKAAKAAKGRSQPAAPVTSVTTASQAHGLRSALGLRHDPDADRALAQRMTAQTRQRAIGRPIDPLPEGATPTVINRPLPTTQEYTATGQRIPQQPLHDALVYPAITERYISAGRLPILDGRQPKGLRLAEMLGNGPLGWDEQRVNWGFVFLGQSEGS